MIPDEIARIQQALLYAAETIDAMPGTPEQRRARFRELRIALTRESPVAFAYIYLRSHLSSDETHGLVSLNDFHRQVCADAEMWAEPILEVGEGTPDRKAYIAPRGTGKSTWLFLILPLWALAHGHRKFIAAFADSGPQAQQHLASLKQELDNNPLLRADYPKLCKPAYRQRGTTVSDSQSLYISASGAAFLAKGIDSSTLGAKVGSQRPDLLLFDDVEPDESNYSAYQKEKRLGTIRNAVFPMNNRAVVVMVGTVTMPGSIMHDLVRMRTEKPEVQPEWPAEEGIDVRYFPALREDGSTLWPERWSADYLRSISHTRSFKLNMQNDPAGYEGTYWRDEDFTYGDLEAATRFALFVDPAVTTKGTSDFTGLAVVAHSPSERRAVVLHAEGVRLTGAPLRAHCLRLIERHPRIKLLRIEVNQGGDLWKEVFHDFPVKVVVYTSTASKEVRFAQALDHYQRGRVSHVERLSNLEGEMTGFPRHAYDDIADAAVAGVLYFLESKKTTTVSASDAAYT